MDNSMLQIQCLQSKTQELHTLFSRFAIGPLKKGQGLTIGNALRRVLLADLQGLAIAGVRIANVNHEFSPSSVTSGSRDPLCNRIRKKILFLEDFSPNFIFLYLY